MLAWSAALLTASYLGIFPQMKMDNTFVASLLTGAMASQLALSARTMVVATKSRLLLTTKTPKLASNEPHTFGIGPSLWQLVEFNCSQSDDIGQQNPDESVIVDKDSMEHQMTQASRYWATLLAAPAHLITQRLTITAPVLGTLTAGSAVGYTPSEYSGGIADSRRRLLLQRVLHRG